MSLIKTFSGFYTTRNANAIERLSDSQEQTFNKLWLYPAKGRAYTGQAPTGFLTLNTGNVWIGEHTEDAIDLTPDQIANADLPLLIELPQGKTKLLRDVIIQAASAGDGVYFKGWTD